MKPKNIFIVGTMFSLSLLAFTGPAYSLPGTLVENTLGEANWGNDLQPVPNNQIEILTCGNGKIDKYEKCDDGNETSGDGCSSNCFIENDDNIVTPSDNTDETPPQIPSDAGTGGCSMASAATGNSIFGSAWIGILSGIAALRAIRRRG